jgi:Tol biopolymer transport system component
VDPATDDGDLFAYIPATGELRPLVVAPGYDGGPFFSPDGRYICYRSDRAQNNLLQLYVSELSFDADGLPNGIVREIELTHNEHVNWAPFWHPSGAYLVYATSEVSHRNYEVFAIPFDAHSIRIPDPVRITHADGFDGLPVFSPDGRHMMWTAQRGADRANNGRPSSQLWIAEVRGTPAFAE